MRLRRSGRTRSNFFGFERERAACEAALFCAQVAVVRACSWLPAAFSGRALQLECSGGPTTRSQCQGTGRAIICTNMPSLRVQIVRFVEAYQPGIVECQFRDSDGQLHSIIGKMPCFTAAGLWWDSEYPQPGEAMCQVLDPPANGAVTIRLAEETTDQRSEFVVPEADLNP